MDGIFLRGLLRGPSDAAAAHGQRGQPFPPFPCRPGEAGKAGVMRGGRFNVQIPHPEGVNVIFKDWDRPGLGTQSFDLGRSEFAAFR